MARFWFRILPWLAIAGILGLLLRVALPWQPLVRDLVVFPLQNYLSFHALLPRAIAGLTGAGWPQRAAVALGVSFPLLFSASAYVANARALLTTLQAGQSQALAYLREECGAAPLLYAGPFIPGFYYESRRLNPTRYDFLFTDFFTDAQLEEAASALRSLPPTCAVVAYPLVAKYGYRLDDQVDRLLAERYRTVLREGPLEVLRLRGR